MRRSVLTILWTSAAYGFAIGSVHSLRLAAWDVVKFPALILLTALICAFAFFACTLLVTRELTFADSLRVSLATFADLSTLLASLAPVSWFLALTIAQPTETSLHEYPYFLGLNVVFIACGGALALVRQSLRLARRDRLGTGRSATILAAWLAISLFAGGQCAWYMRPFFGASTIGDPPFMEGSNPDFRGATSFYEAVVHLVAPPVLPDDYARRGR